MDITVKIALFTYALIMAVIGFGLLNGQMPNG